MVVLSQTQIIKIGSRYHLPVELFLLPMFLKTITMKKKNVIQNFLLLLDYTDTSETQWQLVSSQAWWYTLLIPEVQGHQVEFKAKLIYKAISRTT